MDPPTRRETHRERTHGTDRPPQRLCPLRAQCPGIWAWAPRSAPSACSSGSLSSCENNDNERTAGGSEWLSLSHTEHGATNCHRNRQRQDGRQAARDNDDAAIGRQDVDAQTHRHTVTGNNGSVDGTIKGSTNAREIRFVIAALTHLSLTLTRGLAGRSPASTRFSSSCDGNATTTGVQANDAIVRRATSISASLPPAPPHIHGCERARANCGHLLN